MSTKITICESETCFDIAGAWRIVSQIVTKKDSVIGLSTGRTTNALHHRVAHLYTQMPFDVSRVTFFGVDEVINVPREYSGACYTMLKSEMTDALEIENNQLLMLPTTSDNFVKSCQDFTNEIDRRGGIDLLMLGLGENGHLGFNQPGTFFDSVACATKMDSKLEQRIRQETNISENVELGGVTLGIKDIMHARRIVLVAKGCNKAAIVKAMLKGPITTAVPASILQLHNNCEFLLDRESSKML
jgi:glucosamine-6-phosphate deaminase